MNALASYQVRSRGIGASELGALAESSPWDTPVGVWMRKVGLSSSEDSSPSMRMGQVLERVLVRAMADQLGVRLTHNAMTFLHPDWPLVPLYATPDAFGPRRSTAGEIKVVGHRFDDWKEGPPPYVRLQALGQMACLPKVQRVYVGALMGSELRTWPVDRDPAAIDALVEGVRDWWSRYVVPEVSPPPSGPDDTWALLRARVSSNQERAERIATEPEEQVALELAALMAQATDLAERIEERRRVLAQAAQDNDLVGQGWRGRWGDRRTTDWRAIVAAEGVPEAVVADYTRTAPVFTFRRGREEP